MHKLFNNKSLIILIFILLIGLFFRNYQPISRFEFAHDGELYSWFVKDVVVNNHLRLVGQLTSAPGIFIGPFYYYLLIPFFVIFNMDPIGGIIPNSIIGFLTILSYYIVVNKLYSKYIGLFAAFIYAISLHMVSLDRRVVPSTPTNLWTIWYFYTIVMITRGNFQVLPLLGILLGLIWHIHIAILPALIAIPVAFVFARKLPSLKQIALFFATLFITSLPLIIFETRHNFQQTQALIGNFSGSHGGETGINKFLQVINMVNRNISTIFFDPSLPQLTGNILFTIVILAAGLILIKRKITTSYEILTFYIWILGVILFFTFSSTLISEYYFANIEAIFIVIVSSLLYIIFNSSRLGRVVIIVILAGLLLRNLYSFTTEYIYHKGYVERKAIADFIANDAKSKNYPCISISYITAIGENTGFRYFLWKDKIKLKHPGGIPPVYNIVLPDELALGEIDAKFGHIGIILPKKVAPKLEIEKACEGEDTNITDPMFGYTQ